MEKRHNSYLRLDMASKFFFLKGGIPGVKILKSRLLFIKC